MKKIFLLTILLSQLTFTFGQCTTTQGVELNENITYFKCLNGYNAPTGYEWMKPTKIYIVPYELGSNAQPLHEPNYMVHMENFYRGDDLREALAIYAYLQKKYGNNDLDFLNPDLQSEVICLDCGLGYFATVSLADGYKIQNNNTRRNSYPNVGFGYTCGQPTIEQAIKVAYKAAKEKLKTPAISFSYNVGINTNKKTEGSLSNVLYSTFGDTDASQSFDYSQRGSGYPIIPESPDEFLEYIISLNKLCEQKGNEYGIKRDNDLSYTKVWKQTGIGHEDIKLNEYPIFNDKIGGSSKQSGNVQKTGETEQSNNKQNVKKTKEFSVITSEGGNKLVSSLTQTRAFSKLTFKQIFTELGYNLISERDSASDGNYLNFSEDLFISFTYINDEKSAFSVLICGNKAKLEKQLLEIQDKLIVNHNKNCMKLKYY